MTIKRFAERPFNPSLRSKSTEGVCRINERYKFVFLGDAGTGKTSIITRFIYDSFDPTYQVRPSYYCNLVHDRHRLFVKNSIVQRSSDSYAAMGYGRTRVMNGKWIVTIGGSKA